MRREGKERNGKNGGVSNIFDIFQLLIDLCREELIKYYIKCFLCQMLLPPKSTFKLK